MIKTTKNTRKEFVDACISSGSYMELGFYLPHKSVLEIEDILNRFNDKTARTKINKILKTLEE